MSDGSESEDEDYEAYVEAAHVHERRYPLHDCCEFEDVDALKVRKDTAYSILNRHGGQLLRTAMAQYRIRF